MTVSDTDLWVLEYLESTLTHGHLEGSTSFLILDKYYIKMEFYQVLTVKSVDKQVLKYNNS